jgi:hypothetical protein
MPKVEAWHCPHTNKLFLDETDYRKHLAKLAQIRAAQRKAAKIRATFWQTIGDFQSSCVYFEQIEEWVMANTEVLFGHPGNTRRYDHRGRLQKCPKITKFKFDQMRWNPLCSNSHAAPRGKPTNWCARDADPSVPRGYPGWRGRLSYHTTSYMAWDSSNWKAAGIHTGTGGGGHESSYDVTVFAEEFPNMAFRLLMEGKIAAADLRGVSRTRSI